MFSMGEGSYQTQRTISGVTGRRQREERDEEFEQLLRLVRGLDLEVRGRRQKGEETEMTNSRRSATEEIDIGRDLISPDLGYNEVVHIPGKPISTETVHIRGGLEDIGTSLPLGNRGNAKIAHVLGRTRLRTQSPQRKVGLEMPPWTL